MTMEVIDREHLLIAAVAILTLSLLIMAVVFWSQRHTIQQKNAEIAALWSREQINAKQTKRYHVYCRDLSLGDVMIANYNSELSLAVEYMMAANKSRAPTEACYYYVFDNEKKFQTSDGLNWIDTKPRKV